MGYTLFSDEYFMNEALREARIAYKKNEIPVGCVIVFKNKIIARGHNLSETLNDTTAHAEMQTITSATGFIGGKYLTGATIFVTLEPCLMCMGALFWSKISRIVYGAFDKEQGFSKYDNVLKSNGLTIIHPQTVVAGGILEHECSQLLKEFFKELR